MITLYFTWGEWSDRGMKNIIKNEKYQINVEYTFICLLGVVFLFLYAISTSPLTSNFWGSDSAFFQMVGKNLNRGLIMYKDIFDIKGPYLNLLEYLGYATGIGRYGVFIIEIVNLSITLYFLQKSVNLAAKKYRIQCLIISLILFFFFLSCTLDCGNLSEEYALPYLMACLFFYLRYRIKKQIGMAAFIYGVSFAILSLLKVTNSTFICVLVLDIVITMIMEKKWQDLLKSIGLFLCGMMVAASPFFIYYASKGALFDMIDAAYTFSFLYATKSTFLESIRVMRWPIILVFMVIEAMAFKECWHSMQQKTFLFLNFIIMFITLNLGNAYIHYYQIVIPSILAAFWLWWRYAEERNDIRKRIIIFLSTAIIFNLVYFIPYSGRIVAAVGLNTRKMAQTSFGKAARKIEHLDSYGRGTYGYQAQLQVDDILEKIPKEDYKSVYNYETNPQWLLLSGLKPYSKYCITADNFSCLSGNIAKDIKNMLEVHKPKYIVTNCDVKIENKFVKSSIKNDYVKIYKNQIYSLYQLSSCKK